MVDVCKYYETADAYLGTELMHNMAKLMEIGLHLMVLEEGGPAFPGLGEVCHHSCHWKSALPIRSFAAGLEPKTGCMTIFSFPGGAMGLNIITNLIAKVRNLIAGFDLNSYDDTNEKVHW